MSSNDSFRVSMVQMQVTGDRERNGDRGAELVREAATDDPDLIALPENFNFTGTEEEKLAHAETWDGPTLPKIQEAARDAGTHVLAGAIKMQEEGEDLLRNVSALLGPDGEVKNSYEKVHVFNANVGDTQVENDRVERGGWETVVADVDGVSLGLTVCFDVRFDVHAPHGQRSLGYASQSTSYREPGVRRRPRRLRRETDRRLHVRSQSRGQPVGYRDR